MKTIAGICLLNFYFCTNAAQMPQPMMPQQQNAFAQYPWYFPPMPYPYPPFAYQPPQQPAMQPPLPAQTPAQQPVVVPLYILNALHGHATTENKDIGNPSPVVTQAQVQAQTVVQPTLQERLQPLYTTLKQFVDAHWLGCSLVAVSAVYGVLLTYILRARYRFQHSHLWSSWQRHQTMEQLMVQQHETLKAALVKDIAAQYINAENPTDQVWPLTEFISACKAEEHELRRYLAIAGVLKKTGLYRVFPNLNYDYAQQALTKLLFVYHLFAAWSAEMTWQQLRCKG